MRLGVALWAEPVRPVMLQQSASRGGERLTGGRARNAPTRFPKAHPAAPMRIQEGPKGDEPLVLLAEVDVDVAKLARLLQDPLVARAKE